MVNVKLPEFDNPPLAEVALSVQFEPLLNLSTPLMGLLWLEFRERFPKTEEKPPLETVVERLGARGTGQPIPIKLFDTPPSRRIWFVDKSERELIQIQQDRFIHNWRKVKSDDEYPRYDLHIRKSFLENLTLFVDFIKKENLGELVPNQCEVTYVNHIYLDNEESYKDLGKYFVGWNKQYSSSSLLDVEDISLKTRHIIKQGDNFVGRLHLSIDSAVSNKDDSSMYVITLTSRGKPNSTSIDSIMDFIDKGRKHIVKHFDSCTTSHAHKIWGKNHVK